MNHSRKTKKCPGCGVLINGDNKTLLRHMTSRQKCKKKIVICLGCKKEFVDMIHLKNHQKTQQSLPNGNSLCIQGHEKLEHIKSLTLNIPIFNNKHVATSKKRHIFSVEQPDHNPMNTFQSGRSIDLSAIGNERQQQSNCHKTNNLGGEPISTMTSRQQHINRVIKPNVSSENSTYFLNKKINTSMECREVNTLCVTQSTSLKKQKTTSEFHSNITQHIHPNPYTNDPKGSNSSNDAVKNFTLEETEEDNNTLKLDENVDNDNNSLNNRTLFDNILDPSDKTNNDTIECEQKISHSTISYLSDSDHPNQHVNFDVDSSVSSVQEESESGFEEYIHNNTNDTNKSTKSNSTYIWDRVKFTKNHRDSTLFSFIDKAMIELFLIHRKCGAPIHLFDDTLNWLKKHITNLIEINGNPGYKISVRMKKVPSRKAFVSQMYNQVYSQKHVKKTLPREVDLKIDTSTFIKFTAFDFREVMIDMMSNEDMMSLENLLFFDKENLSKIHPRDSDVGEVITSDVFFNAHKRLCKKDNDVLFPLVMYNDEICFDSYGKLKLDPFSVTFGRFPVHIRNQSVAWRYFGFIHSIKVYDSDSDLDSKKKITIYHKCLKEIFSVLKEIQREGGIPYTFTLPDGSKHHVNLIIYVQFVIGDTKGHDHICGRMACYNLKMNQSVRDCCVTPIELDDTDHICKFRTINEVVSYKTDEDFNNISFHNCENALYDLDMGDIDHGIFGATCSEPLHVFEMQLLELISEAFVDTLSASSLKVLQGTILNIVAIVERQTIKSEFLPVNAFRQGLTKIKQLTGSERHAKVFVIYLALLSSECVKIIANSPAKNGQHSGINYGYETLLSWFCLIEDSLIMMQWLRKPIHPRKDLYSRHWYRKWVKNNKDNVIPTECDDSMSSLSPAQISIKAYLNNYKKLVKRKGNGTKLGKFHHNLHFVRNICRHGSIPNYDGSRPEAIAKDLAKSPGLRTQKHHKSITIQTAKRYHEDIMVIEAERICNTKEKNSLRYVSTSKQDQKKNLYSYFARQTSNIIQISDNIEENIILRGSRYTLDVSISENSNHEMDETTYEIVSNVNLKGTGIKCRIDDDLIFCLTNWLWIDPVGGRLHENSMPKFYTEMNMYQDSYKCHPSYRSDMTWNDWVYVNWGDEYDDYIPAKLYMLFDISGCKIEMETDINDNKKVLSDRKKYNLLPKPVVDAHKIATNYLSISTKWAVIHSADEKCYMDKKKYPSKNHFVSKICDRVNMERNNYRIIPISDIVGRALAFDNHIQLPFREVDEFDNTAIIIDHPEDWEQYFLDMGENDN